MSTGPDPVWDESSVTVVESGSFTQARCVCGWTGPARRSRRTARDDAAAHLRDHNGEGRDQG